MSTTDLLIYVSIGLNVLNYAIPLLQYVAKLIGNKTAIDAVAVAAEVVHNALAALPASRTASPRVIARRMPRHE